MATFKNISDKAFIDGNITVMPNQTLTVNDPARHAQLTDQYGWQFECLDEESKSEAPQAPQTPSNEVETTKSLTKMNKAELESVASELGVQIGEDMTNKQLQAAITSHQKGSA